MPWVFHSCPTVCPSVNPTVLMLQKAPFLTGCNWFRLIGGQGAGGRSWSKGPCKELWSRMKECRSTTIYIYIYIYICIHACMHASIHTSIHPYIHPSIPTYIHTTYVHTHTYIHTCMHACIHIYIYIYAYAPYIHNVYIYIYTYIYIHIHIYIYTHIYTYIYMYIHICICIWLVTYMAPCSCWGTSKMKFLESNILLRWLDEDPHWLFTDQHPQVLCHFWPHWKGVCVQCTVREVDACHLPKLLAAKHRRVKMAQV